MSLHLQFDVTVGPLDKNGYRAVELHSLRIQLPEELEQAQPTLREQAKPALRGQDIQWDAKKEKGAEKENGLSAGNNTEYDVASPCYTWTDEHVRSAKQEKLGELLWPIVLRSYGLSPNEVSSFFGTYQAFLASSIYRSPESHREKSIYRLMEWYVDVHLHLMKTTEWSQEEKETLKRRHLLRRLIDCRKVPWSSHYMEAYLEWSKGCRPGMNRYQKMVLFVETFFDA